MRSPGIAPRLDEQMAAEKREREQAAEIRELKLAIAEDHRRRAEMIAFIGPVGS